MDPGRQAPCIKVGHSYRIRRDDFETWRANLVVRPDNGDFEKELDVGLGPLYQAWLLELQNGSRPCSESTVTTHRAHFMKHIRVLVESAPQSTLTYLQAASERRSAMPWCESPRSNLPPATTPIQRS